jgi:hypothetical protein
MTDMQTSLEEILTAIRQEEHRPSHAALLRWLKRYPEHGDALEDFFVTWATEPETPETADIGEARLANRLVSYALGLVHARREAAANSVPEKQEPLRLLDVAKQRGITAQELAARMRLDEDIILKLDLRRLRNVPRLVLFWLKTALGSTDSPFGQMVTGPPVMSLAMRHRAERRPEPRTEDFVDSVRNSSLSEEDKAFWNDVVAADRDRGDAP